MKTKPTLEDKIAIPTGAEYDAAMLIDEATHDATHMSVSITK